MSMNLNNEVNNLPEGVHIIPPPEATPDTLALLVASVPEVKEPPVWKKYRIRDYIWAIAACIVLLYVLNNLMDIYVPWSYGDFSQFFWNILNNIYNHVEIPFLSKAYIQCLWAINIALTAGILGNFILLLYRPRWAHYLIQAIISGLSLIAVYVVWAIYPFRFDSSRADSIVKIVLILIMVGMALGLLNSFVRFVLAIRREMNHSVEKILPLATPVTEQSPKE
jgi:hypothetical protein